AFRNPALRQKIGKTIHGRAKRRIREITDAVVAADPAQGQFAAAPGFYMPVDRLMGNVEAATGKAIKQPARLRPGKRLGALVIVDEVGADVFFRTFSDSLQFHGWPWAIFLKLRTSHAAPRAPAAVPNPPKSEICVYMIVKFGWNALRCVKSIQTEKGILFLLMEARDHADAGRNRISRHGSEAANPGRSCQACR